MFKEDVIQSLFNDINKNNNQKNTLLGGDAGRLLFKYFYLNRYADTHEIALFNEEIQVLAENSFQIIDPTFCNGLAGVDWFFKFLNQKGNLLDDEDIALICDKDNQLANASLKFIKEGNYDFLHGAIGIAYYLLYKDPLRLQNCFTEFFAVLSDQLIKDEKGGSFADYDFVNKKKLPEEVNFGLAHGIPSILKFCIQCIKMEICIDQSRYIANFIIIYIMNNADLESTYSIFPNRIRKDENNLGQDSRLAWCYGDLGIGFILYQAGVVLNDLHLQLFAQNVLKRTCTRKLQSDTKVTDACICHGTAGIAHIYNKMWYYTKDEVFKSSSEYWLNETLNLSVFEDGVGGYKMHRIIPEPGYENVYGVLGGAAGVGLVLLSFLTEDFSWDYCLMLND